MDEKEALPDRMMEDIGDTIRRNLKNLNLLCEDLENLKSRMVYTLLELDLKKVKNKKHGKLYAFLKRSFG